MHTRMQLAEIAAVLFVAGSALGQYWQFAGSSPGVSFGLLGDLLVHDGVDWVGYDELGSQTLLGTGGGFVTSSAPIPQLGLATLCERNGVVFLFGGLTGSGPTSAVWRFERSTGWSQLSSGGPGVAGPSPRFGSHACRFGSSQHPIFFGGQDASGVFTTDTWMLLASVQVPWLPVWSGVAPAGRVRHALASGPGGSAVLFGGSNGTPMGDTWILGSTGWVQYTGPGPAPTADARMVYDTNRNMTVLVHPNGETWEWNGYRWRLVGAVGAPVWSQPAVAFAPNRGTSAFQPAGSQIDRYDFHPSPAGLVTASDAGCPALPWADLALLPFERSLPVLGQTLHLQAEHVPPTSFFVGVYEFPQSVSIPLGCNCTLEVSGSQSGLQFVPGTNTLRDWQLAIPPLSALHSVALDVQGVVVGNAQPCFAMTTSRLTFVFGW